MKKMVVRAVAIFLGVFVSVGVFVIVLISEQNKRATFYAAARTHYDGLYKDWESYEKDYLSQIEEIRVNNKKTMAEAEKNYNELLGKQQELIDQNKKVVVKTQPSTSKTQSQQVQVQKPKSKPVTRAS